MIGGYYARTLIGEIGYLMVVEKKNLYAGKIAQGFMKPPRDRLRLCVLAGTKIQRLFRGTGSLSIYMEDPLTTIWEEKHVRNETHQETKRPDKNARTKTCEANEIRNKALRARSVRTSERNPSKNKYPNKIFAVIHGPVRSMHNF